MLPWYTSKSPCALCACNASDVPWTDFKAGALWLTRQQVTWAAAMPRRHELFMAPFSCGIASFFPDVMHTKHMGTDAWFYGSVLWLLCFELLPNSPEANLQVVWSEAKRHLQQHGEANRFNNLKLSMFVNEGGFPKLKGRAIEIRNLGPPLVEIWSNRMDGASPVHKQVRLALKASCAFDDVMDRSRHLNKLLAAEVLEIQKAVKAFLLCLTALGEHYHPRYIKLFNITIKCHYLAHIGLLAEYINPRLGWCYSQEDLMAKIKRLVSNCFRGTPPHLISAKNLAKYCLGMHLRFLGEHAVAQAL